MLLALPCPVVIDHLGRIPPGQRANHPGFASLLRLLESGRVWVKLSEPGYSSAEPFPHGDVAARVRALVAARPDRLVWGANWPHPDHAADATPDDAALFALLRGCMGDAPTQARILRDNPGTLYFSD